MVRLAWYPGCGQPGYHTCASAGSPDNTPGEPHPNSNTQHSKNNTANVVVQQHSRKLLQMDILTFGAGIIFFLILAHTVYKM